MSHDDVTEIAHLRNELAAKTEALKMVQADYNDLLVSIHYFKSYLEMQGDAKSWHHVDKLIEYINARKPSNWPPKIETKVVGQ